MRVDIHGQYLMFKVFSAASADLIEEKINSWLYAYNNVVDAKDVQANVTFSGGTYVAVIRCQGYNKGAVSKMKYDTVTPDPADGGFKYDPAMFNEPSL